MREDVPPERLHLVGRGALTIPHRWVGVQEEIDANGISAEWSLVTPVQDVSGPQFVAPLIVAAGLDEEASSDMTAERYVQGRVMEVAVGNVVEERIGLPCQRRGNVKDVVRLWLTRWPGNVDQSGNS